MMVGLVKWINLIRFIEFDESVARKITQLRFCFYLTIVKVSSVRVILAKAPSD